MSKAEEDYSDYIQHLSNLGNMYTFLAGFMFTAITIILTQLPERTTVMAQIALFFMASMLDVFILYMGYFYMNVVYLCKQSRHTQENQVSQIS